MTVSLPVHFLSLLSSAEETSGEEEEEEEEGDWVEGSADILDTCE